MSSQLITIYTFTLPHEAYIIKGRLESEGITCFLKDELTIQIDNFYSNALNGVKLQVMEKDAADAIAIMKEVGFNFGEEEKPSRFLIELKNFTEKIPLLNKIDFLWRLLIMITLLISLCVIVIYLIQRKSVPELLTTNNWIVEYIAVNDTIIYDPDPSIGYDPDIRFQMYYGTFLFNSSGKLNAKLYWDKDCTANWNYKNGLLTLSGFKGESVFLNREYSIIIDEDQFSLRSDELTIFAYYYSYKFPF